MICICPAHKKLIHNCDFCFEKLSSLLLLKPEERSLRDSLISAIDQKKKLQTKKEELEKTLQDIKENLYQKNSILPKNHIKQKNLLEYICNIKLPNNIFSIIYNPDLSLAFMLQKKLIPLNFECCGKSCVLKRIGCMYYHVCKCGSRYGVLENTIWNKHDLPLGKIILLLFSWLMNLTSTDISKMLSLEHSLIVPIIDEIRHIVSSHYTSSLPKFSGTVEIDESCFLSSQEKLVKNRRDRWVFGLYERNRKLVYMEVVKKRNANTLIPIILKRCEAGTTIISDQWGAYSKLEEFGFPHYTVDHSRFFVNPSSREIHTQDIEISWCWAKYNVRKHIHIAPLSDLLHVFCWMRQYKQFNKQEEIAVTMDALIQILSAHKEKI